MRGQTTTVFSVEVLTRTLQEEFPDLDPARLRTAVERGVARQANASLDTEGYRVVDLHLSRAEATEESAERAQILRELAENLEHRGDADRAFVVRIAAFSAAPVAVDLDPLLRLARITERWSELPLDTMSALIDINDDESPRRLTEMATAWQRVGRVYYAADCLERVLLLKPTDRYANETLETFYRSTGEWPSLIDLLGRRAVHLESDRERAELYREIAQVNEHELQDDSAALDAYQEADRLAPGQAEVLEALARLAVRVGLPEEEVLIALERLGGALAEPVPRAKALCRAAEIACKHNWDRAQQLFERARKDNPDLVPAIDGLAVLLRDRGELGAAIALLVKAAARPALVAERSRWLADAADYRIALGEFEEAKALYREARVADPTNHRAGVALVELCWDTGSLVELAPILDELCRTTDDPERLRGYLIQRSKVAVELGEGTSARNTLARAVALGPTDPAARRELADLLFDNQEWARARPLLEDLLDESEGLQPDLDSIDLHYRVARCAHQMGDDAIAEKHAAITLALAPDHRPALLLRAELDTSDPDALLADQLSLANSAPAGEKASRFAALGDRYAERGDRATAREMYREALAHRPTDHLLLTKSLSLVADDGDWSYSLDLLQRLIDTEKEPKVRARYRHTAAMILRDEIDDADRATTLLDQAIEDDPMAFTAADELEAMLGVATDRDALVGFYYRRLEHMRSKEGRPSERLRLWDRLGELSLQLGRTDDAVVALEVALSLDGDNAERRERLADLYLEADPKHDLSAIVQHQAVLRTNKRRASSYEALRTLYLRTRQPEKARACHEAVALLGTPATEDKLEDKIEEISDGDIVETLRARQRSMTTLTNEDWLALARIDVDLQLSALFALVAPAFAAERARMRPPPALPAREHPLSIAVGGVLAQVVSAFGIPRPPVYFDPRQATASNVAMRVRDGVLAPILIVGPALDTVTDEQELAFVLARQLADLRNDRIARLLCPRPGELAQIVELAAALTGDGTSHAARWLTTSLHPLELDQVRTIGARLRERSAHPMTSALNWLAATERAADRIGFVVVGDLGVCARVIEREPATSVSDLNRVLDLLWSSVTEEVLVVRGRLEDWGGRRSASHIRV
ncbi:MAG: Tetratricopeptide 2 repeat protein [Deltaproteobacteria bacterium]|nr:Tetratricopeptide 2 repeat protein [Deltaproteobacteria bacterium]